MMKKYNVLQIALLCTMLHTSHGIYTAEESKENYDTIDISNIAADYPMLEEGFQILHSRDTNVPSFHDYVQNDLDTLGHDNFGDAIENAEGYIADNMQKKFLDGLENQITLAKEAYIKFDKNNLCAEMTGGMFNDLDLGYCAGIRMSTAEDDDYMQRKYDEQRQDIDNMPTIHQAIITTFYETQDPIFSYLLKYQHIFLPHIFNTIKKDNPTAIYQLMNGAVRFNHLSLVEMLFNFKAIDVYNAQYNIRKYLHDAVENYSLPITKLLLENTPLSMYQQFSFLIERAILNDDIEILDLLLSHGVFPSNTILDMAIDRNNTTAVKKLLAFLVNIEEKDHKGLTPLIHAIQKKNIAIVDALLQAGANPNNPTEFKKESQMIFNGQISYQIDSLGKQVDIKTQELTDSLPNFNTSTDESAQKRDIYGYTPLQEAVYVNSLDIAKLLIAHGADVNTCNIFDGTALQIAERYNLDEIAQFLRNNGAISYTPNPRDLNIRLRKGPDFLNLLGNNNPWGDTFTSLGSFEFIGDFDAFPQEEFTYEGFNVGSAKLNPSSTKKTLLDLIKKSKIDNARSENSLQQTTSSNSGMNNQKRARKEEEEEEESAIPTKRKAM